MLKSSNRWFIPPLMADFQLSSLFMDCFERISHHSKWYTDSSLHSTDSAPASFFLQVYNCVSRDSGKVSCFFQTWLSQSFLRQSSFCWIAIFLLIHIATGGARCPNHQHCQKGWVFLRPLFSWWRRYRVTSQGLRFLPSVYDKRDGHNDLILGNLNWCSPRIPDMYW